MIGHGWTCLLQDVILGPESRVQGPVIVASKISLHTQPPPLTPARPSIAIGTCLSLLRCVAATLAKPCALAAARSIERAHRRVVGAPSFVKVHSSIKDPALLFGRPQAAITNQAAMVLMAERGCGTPVHVRHRERSAPSHALVEHGFTTDDERIRHAHHTSATRRYQRVAIDQVFLYGESKTLPK